QPRHPGQIHRGLGMAGPAQHPTLLRQQRHHVAGPEEVGRARGRVGEQPHRAGPVGGGDPGAHPARVHSHPVRGTARVLVGVVHRGQVEPVTVFGGHRDAHIPGGVPHHERQQRRGGELGGEDQVAFVLPILVVDHHHRPPGRDLRHGPLDTLDYVGERPVRRRAGLRGGHDPTPVTCFSTYLATMSTSRLTSSPTARRPSVVSRNVVGINPTSNQSSPIPVTVRETPSTAIEPFSTTYRDRPGGSANRTVSQSCPLTRESTVPTPSTWPWTRWPPRRVARVAARSRFTGSPGRRVPKVLRSKVSRITSAVNVPSAPTVVAVRQTPLTAIESPKVRSAATRGRRTVITFPCRPASSPSSSTRPVNIQLSTFRGSAVNRRSGPTRVTSSSSSAIASATVPTPASTSAVGPAPSSFGAR